MDVNYDMDFVSIKSENVDTDIHLMEEEGGTYNKNNEPGTLKDSIKAAAAELNDKNGLFFSKNSVSLKSEDIDNNEDEKNMPKCEVSLNTQTLHEQNVEASTSYNVNYISDESEDEYYFANFENDRDNMLSKFKAVKAVNCEQNGSHKPYLDPSDTTTVFYYSNNNQEKVAFFMGYQYSLSHSGKFYNEWKCHKLGECLARMRILSGDKALLPVGEHTCDKSEKTRIFIDYQPIKVRNYSKLSPFWSIKELEGFLEQDHIDSQTVLYFRYKTGARLARYMGYNYLIDRKNMQWKCEKFTICSATVVIDRGETSALLIGKHTCDKIEEDYSQIECQIKEETDNEGNIIREEVVVEPDLDLPNVITEGQEARAKSKEKISHVADKGGQKNECHQNHTLATISTNNNSANTSNCITADSRGVKGLIPVKIINCLSDVQSKFKAVPVEEQSNYNLFHFDQNIIFKGFTYLKVNDTINGNMFNYLCVNSFRKNCPAEIRLQNDKVVEYSDHICDGNKLSENPSIPQWDPNDTGNLLLYNDNFSGEERALYKGFSYQKNLDREYYALWKCVNRRFNCKACVKYFHLTSLLVEIGKHLCTPDKVRNLKSPKTVKKTYVKYQKCSPIKPICFNKTYELNKLLHPQFSDKRLIPVIHKKYGPLLIYNGFVYLPSKDSAEEDTCWYSCYNSKCQECKGVLCLSLDGKLSVSAHDCFKKMKQNEELFLFEGRRLVQFAMFKGYIYKKWSKTCSIQNVYRWNCHGGRTKCCDSILTTENETVVSVSIHSCREEDDDGKEEKIVEIDEDLKVKRRRIGNMAESSNETVSVTNKQRASNMVQTQRKSDDDVVTVESE